MRSIALLILLATSIHSHIARAEKPFLVTVTAGDFDVHVVETARLDARQSVTLSSDLPSNKGKIIWLVEEGSYISKGGLVAKFDPVPFEEELASYQREYQDGKAGLAQAEAELQIQIRAGKEAVEQGHYNLKLSKLRLHNLLNADQPLRMAAIESELQSAQIALDIATQELKTQQNMEAEGFGNGKSLLEAKAIFHEKETGVDLKAQSKRLLEQVIFPTEINQSQLDIDNQQQKLENAEQMRLHTLAKQNNLLVRLRNQLQQLDVSLKHAKELLSKTEIRAPVSGFVVYKTLQLGNERRKAQIGDSVWNRHGFIVLPDMSQMVGHLNIREQDIGKIALGQRVTMKPDAYPDLEVSGHVDMVGTLVADNAVPDENSFHVRIALDDVDPRLRPGMNAQATILTGSYSDVLRVPVEAVFYANNEAICYVWDQNRSRPQPVKLGSNDGEYVIISQGLEAGQQVLLSNPRQAVN